MNRRFLWIVFLLFTGGMFFSNSATAQFTYGGVRLSYHNVRFDKGVDFEGTRLNDLAVNFDLVHRPLRNVGIGVSARLPVIHGFKYQFLGEEYSDHITGGGSFNESKVEFAGGEFEYDIINTYSLTLLGRVYFDTYRNFFLDVRYSFENYEEMLRFNREADGSLAEINIDHQESVTAKGVGFSVGAKPMIGDHFYFGYIFTVDFLSYDQFTFQKNIETYNNNYQSIDSKLHGKFTAYEFSVTVGYAF